MPPDDDADDRRLEALLRDALRPPGGLPPTLAARLASIPATEPPPRRPFWASLAGGRLAWGAALAASAAAVVVALGPWDGGEPAAPYVDNDAYVELASLAFGPQLEPEDEP